jgi:hypothetical protein
MTLARSSGGFGSHVSQQGWRVAGEIVAFVETTFGVDSGSSTLVIVDVGARRRLREAPVGSYVDAGLIRDERLAALVLTPRGSAAWVTTSSNRGVAGPASVHLAGRTGPVLVLDEGTAVDPASLRLEGSTLSWSDGGTRRSHPMP